MNLNEIVKKLSANGGLGDAINEAARGKWSVKLPEISLPIREDDCPAAPVCEAIGNIRKGCLKGGNLYAGQSTKECLISIILLMSFASGMWPEEKLEELQNERKIGFLPDDNDQ